MRLGKFCHGFRPLYIQTNETNFYTGSNQNSSIINELAQIKTTGYLTANALIKTKFKELKSNGSIVVKDGSFIKKVTKN